MENEDTITAVSTAQGTAAIGIIRISGANAFEIAAKVFKTKEKFDEIKSHTVSYGKIFDPSDGRILDEVLVLKMQGPRSFTKEDMVEINCHGGMVIVRDILELIIRQGARPAGPGEFTKRAFINGRLDLSQAEAVIDLINSKTTEGSKAAIRQLEGRLSEKIREARKKLVELIAHIEVTVDYPEHDIEEITGKMVLEQISVIRQLLINLLVGFNRGRILREGASVVITGKPNAGKSSLLNELSGKSKAIVTDIPGTTRDIIEEYINIAGIPVRLVDTAGIRQTEDIVEKLGVERAENAIKNADLVILMIDADAGISNEDNEMLEALKDKKLIIALNKIDRIDEKRRADMKRQLQGKNLIELSLIEGIGLDVLEREIENGLSAPGTGDENEILLTNIRHKELIDKALKSIEDAMGAYEAGIPLDCMAIDIKGAAEYLGQITGESINEDVAHEIFSRFCIGK